MTEVREDQEKHEKRPLLLRRVREGILALARLADTGAEISLEPKIQEANSHLRYEPEVEYKLPSKKADQIDRAIATVIEKSPSRVNLDFLRLFGSPRMQVEFFAPIFEGQIRKGRLTTEIADQFCQEITDGGLKLLFQDIAIGTGIGWASTKILTLPLSVYLTKEGYPKLATSLMLLDHFTAIWEIPYFSFRAVQEYRYFKEQIAEVSDIEELKRDRRLRRRASFLGATVLINILPMPLCWFNGIFMTFPRNTGITLTLLHHNLDQMEEGYTKWEGYRDKLLQAIGKDKFPPDWPFSSPPGARMSSLFRNFENVTHELGDNWVVRVPAIRTRLLGRNTFEYLKKMRSDYDCSRRYIAGYIVETHFVWGGRKGKERYFVVQKSLKGRIRTLRELSDEEMHKPEIRDQLERFIDGVLLMHEETGILPDLYARPAIIFSPRFYDPRFTENILFVEDDSGKIKLCFADIGEMSAKSDDNNPYGALARRLVVRNLRRFRESLENPQSSS